jgi:hypothetical protein
MSRLCLSATISAGLVACALGCKRAESANASATSPAQNSSPAWRWSLAPQPLNGGDDSDIAETLPLEPQQVAQSSASRKDLSPEQWLALAGAAAWSGQADRSWSLARPGPSVVVSNAWDLVASSSPLGEAAGEGTNNKADAGQADGAASALATVPWVSGGQPAVGGDQASQNARGGKRESPDPAQSTQRVEVGAEKPMSVPTKADRWTTKDPGAVAAAQQEALASQRRMEALYGAGVSGFTGIGAGKSGFTGVGAGADGFTGYGAGAGFTGVGADPMFAPKPPGQAGNPGSTAAETPQYPPPFILWPMVFVPVSPVISGDHR